MTLRPALPDDVPMLERWDRDPAVMAIVIDPLASNERAIVFYRRLGYQLVARQWFGEDDCHVHRLERRVWEQTKR